MQIQSGKNKKDMNFELNLIPVFDILSACICFLLMTAVWIQIGSMDVSQALGGQSSDAKNPPSVLVYLNPKGEIQISLKDVTMAPTNLSKVSVHGQNGEISWKLIDTYIVSLHKSAPQVKTALIMPGSKSQYEDIVRLMDKFKVHGVSDIGISPL